MKKILMIDVKKCTGCRICELVCSLSHDGECNPLKSRIRVFNIEEEGIDMPCV
jgi:Fe-S-cluster-containing hydrogenase component 2